MDRDFAKDVNDGLNKIMEICQWLKDSFHIEVGRNLKSWQNEKENVIDIEAVDSSLNKKEVESPVAKIKNIYHRKDGRWEYVRTVNKNTIHLIARTKELLQEKINNLKEQTTTKISLHTETVASYAMKWLKTYKTDIKQGTFDRYESIIKNHIEPYFKNISLKKLKQEQVQKFLNSITASRTKEYAYITIRQILQQAFYNKKTNENIALYLSKPKIKKSEPRTALSLEQQSMLIDEIKKYDDDLQMFVMFSLVLGSRRAETCEFRFEDINKDKNQILIRGTKTLDSKRKIKISNKMIKLLESHKKASDKEKYFAHHLHYYTHKVKEVLNNIGAEDKTLHDLRHTCSTNLFYLNVPDKQRQQILGHSTIVMTNDIYTNLQEDINAKGLFKLYNNLYFKY